jgi:pyruvate/2-oxoglutarate dehydrogenase complex dihydrolipoamide dehydrogenase (E3) component
MTVHFDVIVIGAGSAGSGVASALNAGGLSVGQVERWRVGGTCLNAGCDPTKTLLETAHVLHRARTADRLGLMIPRAAPDWAAIRSRVRRVIDEIRDGDGDANVRAEGISLFKADACFVDPYTLELAPTGERISAERIVIATGSEEVRPAIEGLGDSDVRTNVSIIDIGALPRRLAIIGGGTIATEFAQMFARLDVGVTIIGSADRIMPREEPRLTDQLTEVLTSDGVTIRTGLTVRRIERRGTEHVLFGAGKDAPDEVRELAIADMILLAAGRKPVVDLGLDRAGVEFDAKAGITVDAFLRTSAAHIWAAGDCATPRKFTHVAHYQAEQLAANILAEIRGHGDARPIEDHVIPWATFTEPELARVGLTEREARAAGHDIVVAELSMEDQPRAIATDQQEGMVRLVVERGGGRILGGHILSARGGEMLAEIVLAMRHDLPVSAIAETIHSYPTFGQAVQFAAQDAEQQRGAGASR